MRHQTISPSAMLVDVGEGKGNGLRTLVYPVKKQCNFSAAGGGGVLLDDLARLASVVN